MFYLLPYFLRISLCLLPLAGEATKKKNNNTEDKRQSQCAAVQSINELITKTITIPTAKYNRKQQQQEGKKRQQEEEEQQQQQQ